MTFVEGGTEFNFNDLKTQPGLEGLGNTLND